MPNFQNPPGRTLPVARRFAHNVAYVPGTPFFAGHPDSAALRPSFTTHATSEIADGLNRLAKALC